MFTEEIYIKTTTNHKTMELTKQAVFIYDKEKIKIPEGFIWDGASLPRAVWSIIGSPFVGKYQKASLIHDYMCNNKSEYTLKYANKVFYTTMIAYGVNKSKAKIMTTCVNLFQKLPKNRGWKE